MLLKKTLLAASFVVLPMTASAFDYNFAQVTFTDVDTIGDSGLTFEGSYEVSDNIAVIGSYLTAGDFTRIIAGASYRPDVDLGLSNNTSLEIHGAIDKYDVEFCVPNFFNAGESCASSSETGFIFGSLVRYEQSEKLELFGDISYTTAGEGDIALTGGAMYEFSDNLHVIGSLTLADADILEVGVRYNFGN